MKLFVILGNQLFPLQYVKKFRKNHLFFMSEDYELCSYEKHHKLKLLFYLSCMRSYCDELKENGFNVSYLSSDSKDFKVPFFEKLKRIMIKSKVNEIVSFEIEDKPFEKKFNLFVKKEKIIWNTIKSPMFINSRDKFNKYLKDGKKPLMQTFYKETRRDLNILIEDDKKPTGGKWSYDTENRKRIPKEIDIPILPKMIKTNHTSNLITIIEKHFKNHHGNLKDFRLATRREDAIKLLNFFLDKKLDLFGDYEDAVSQKDNILFHSALSTYMNVGLITPEEIIKKTIDLYKKRNIKLNSLEGFIRQIIGWREFLRGIYQNYSKKMETENFFNHKRKMKKSWYAGNTGIVPLDHSIKNALHNGWSHHIERLMILANIMNLCEIKPKFVYKWFMEMYIDSSEWVMVPNIYGMGLFSDGGIFSTKPYICGSNYLLKMTDFKKGEWCDIVDGLYWRFIDKNRDFFLSNARLAMMVRIFDSMKNERKSIILDSAERFIGEHTE